MRSLKYNKKDFFYDVIALILAIFGVTGALLTYLIPDGIIRIMIALIVISIEVFFLFQSGIKRSNLLYVLLPFLMGICMLNNNAWPLYRVYVYCALLLLPITILRNIKIADKTLKIIWIACIFYALCTIFLFFNRGIYINHVVNLFPKTKDRLIGWYNKGYMAGLTNHYSTNGMFMATGFLLAVSRLDFRKLNQNKSVSKWFFIALFLVALLLTGKRAHVIFSIASLYFVYYLSQSHKRAGKKITNIIGLLILGLLIGSVLLSIFPALAAVVTKFRATIDNGDILVGRAQLWKIAIDAFKEKPVFGIGWKQYMENYSYHYNGVRLYDTHNVYLQLLCETGIVGFLIYCFWFVFMLYKSIVLYKWTTVNNNENIKKDLITFSVAFQFFFLLYCMTGNPLYDLPTEVPYFVACGIIVYYANQIGTIDERSFSK